MMILLLLYTGINASIGYNFNGITRDPLEVYFGSMNPISIIKGLYHMISKSKPNVSTNSNTETTNSTTNKDVPKFDSYEEMMAAYSKYKKE